MDAFELIRDVGVSIAATVIMGVFIFMVLKQILDGLLDDMKVLTGFCNMLETRARTMNNELVKIDTLVSSALDLN